MKRKLYTVIRITGLILSGLLLTAAALLYALTKWLDATYDMSFDALLYTLLSPLKGTGTSIITTILKECLPPVIACVIFYIVIAFIIYQRRVRVSVSVRRLRKDINVLLCMRFAVLILSVVLLLNACVFCNNTLGISEWFGTQANDTTIYEDHYIDPNDVQIEANGKSKNLIYIYIESGETTYASGSAGGSQNVNYIPNMTAFALSDENVSFSDSELLGGFTVPPKSGWTMAALYSTTSGLPFAFPADGNGMDKYERFASGVTALGDILQSKGYIQEFLCGSDANFAGRKDYFEQHGNYEIYDYFTAIDKGYIDKDHKVWWGYEDYILYEIAKDEALRLADTGEPFNLTFLTVDQHHIGGYVCPACGDDYDVDLANVLTCGDRLLKDFVDWCKEQDFYEDTVIVITGDHLRMDTVLVEDVPFARRKVYNCFINSGRTPVSAKNRTFTTQDIFPTVLYAMGFDIEGDRLGLGTNLFSGRPTLAEELGIEYYKNEINKPSLYYITRFT